MGLSNIELITKKRKELKIQLKPEHLFAISSEVQDRAECNLLVFGLGHDTPFWLDMNKSGRTVFIEDNQKWFDRLKQKHPDVEAYLVDYDTKRWMWKKLLGKPEKLRMKLPEAIQGIKWDVILVDAPAGWFTTKPGRMKSIFMASKLVNDSGHVFVHDCHRRVERAYCDAYLKQENLIKEVGKLRHYCI